MSFQIALSGLNAASTDLQVTSDNIANANTTAFKDSRAEFADLFSGQVSQTGSAGSGVTLADVRQEFTQGNVNVTGRQLDLAINGNGFFIVNKNGSQLYSRVGSFGLDAQGYVQNSDSERLQVYPPLRGGTFNTGALQDLQLSTQSSPPIASTAVTASLNLPASDTVPTATPLDVTNPQSYNHSTSTSTYDSQGVAHTTTYFFAQTGTGWDVAMTIDGNQVGTAQPFTFNASGALATPAGGIISFGSYSPPNGALPMAVNLNLSGGTEFGNSFTVNNISTDGQAAGQLNSVQVDSTGTVFAQFSNGQSIALGQIALANFSNPEGLQKVSNTSFQETYSSGSALKGQATVGEFGTLQSGALEASNVDLTEQLVNMITAQRLFQANAQVISTLDQVTQTIINLR